MSAATSKILKKFFMILANNAFINILASIGSRDTSADPDNWSDNNPLWGHCAVVSLLAQDVFGGEIYRGSLKHVPKYAYLSSHFWNKIGNKMFDFTQSQYPDISYQDLPAEIRTREEILSYPDTLRRYTLLKERYARL